MASYAFLDKNNFVTEVIVGKEPNELLDGLTPEEWYGNFRGQKCLQTETDGSIRKNFAGIGYTYDAGRDAFIAPKPYPSWVLDEETCRWNAPVPYPTDEKLYSWDETTLSWVEVTP